MMGAYRVFQSANPITRLWHLQPMSPEDQKFWEEIRRRRQQAKQETRT
jgi:hypothetical protein